MTMLTSGVGGVSAARISLIATFSQFYETFRISLTLLWTECSSDRSSPSQIPPFQWRDYSSLFQNQQAFYMTSLAILPLRPSAKASSTRSTMEALAVAPMFFPALLQTAASAWTTDGAISFSPERIPPMSSVISGSTLGCTSSQLMA